MKIAQAFRNILSGLYLGLRRFPVSILLSTAVALALIVLNESHPASDTLARVAMILALGIPLSLCINLWLERDKDKSIFKFFIYYIIGTLILILYYIFLLKEFDMVPITRYIATSLALYLAFFFIPYIAKKDGFEMYVIKVLTGFFTTVIYSLVLFLGLSAILFTVDRLLSIQVSGEIYYYTWLIVALIFGPSYFLAQVPLGAEVHAAQEYPKLFKILVLYIVMPLISSYTVILYIYFGKILFTRQWPVGLVSHLVLWYSVIVAFVLFFITPIRMENLWASKFSKWLPKLIIPILVMMFVSMGIRIKAYGITENRYYVLVLGLWVLLVMLYYSITKSLRNILLPITLSIVALISVFGPLSSYSISKLSQNKRFESILVRNDMISEGKVRTAPSSISSTDKKEISQILDYFNFRYSLGDVRYIPKDFKMEDIEKVFGFQYENAKNGGPADYFYFTRDNKKGVFEIQGYDYMFDSRSIFYESNPSEGDIDITLNPESTVLKLNLKGQEVYTKDFGPFINNLVEKYGSNFNNSKENLIPPEEMTLIDENDRVKVKIIFINISGSKNLSLNNIESKGLEFYILVKVK